MGKKKIIQFKYKYLGQGMDFSDEICTSDCYIVWTCLAWGVGGGGGC